MNQYKKKITFVTPWSVYGEAGAERSVANLVNNLSGKFDVNLIIIASESIDKPQVLSDNIHVHIVVASRVRFSIMKMKKLFDGIKPDIIVSNIPYISTVTLVAQFFSKNKALHVSVNRGINVTSYINNLHIYITYFLSDKYIVVSQEAKEFMKKKLYISGKKTTVIYNGFDLEAQKIRSLENVTSEEKIWNMNVPSIIGVGRLEKQKSFGDLIKAVEKIVYEYNIKVNLLLVGEGSLHKELESLAKKLRVHDHVYFLGWQKNPLKYIRYSDVLVLSSLYEGLPNTLIEALICGTQIVSTNCVSGPREILCNGKYGSIVPVGDFERMAKEIVSKLSKKIDTEILQQRASHFSQEKTARMYESLFIKLL